MSSNKIIVTGSNGQLGSELRALSTRYPQFRFYFFNRDEFPVHDEAVAESVIEALKPAYLINCAAYTAVDKAETEKEEAAEINGRAAGILARISKQHQTRFIHISTDYVFNGEQNRPLKETDPVDPVNAYGQTKLLGEQEALKNNPDSLVIRTSWVYSSFGKNFVKTMMRLMNEKETVSVVNDQIGSPTYAGDLAEAIMQIIVSGKWEPGIFHFSNEGVISWFDFATEIHDQIKSSCKLLPISTEQFPTPAKRPKFSVMDKSKIQSVYAIQMKDWKESLMECMELILES